MALHFTNTTPKILIYTAGGMGESFQEYLMDKVAILDHIIEDAPHEGDIGQIEVFRGIVKEHGKYDIFFNLGETAMFDYLAIADELADRTTFLGITTYSAALLGCMLLNVSTKGSIGSFETMGISFAESHFGLQPEVAGLIVSLNGMIGVGFLLGMGTLGKSY